MIGKLSYIVLVVFVLRNFQVADGQTAKCESPNLQQGQAYLDNAGCTLGTKFNTTEGLSCLCLNNCGYLCSTPPPPAPCPPSTLPTGTTWMKSNKCPLGANFTTTDNLMCQCSCNNKGYLCSPTPPPRQCPPATLATGERYVAASGCPFGKSYGTSTEKCECCSNTAGYICKKN